MARITTGYTFGLTIPQTMACRMMALGRNEKDVLKEIFLVNDETPDKERKKAVKTLHQWMADPKYAECFRAIVKEQTLPAYGAAMQRIMSQINDSNGWLANKAANDILTRFGPVVLGEDSREVVIRIEGMPELGEPEE